MESRCRRSPTCARPPSRRSRRSQVPPLSPDVNVVQAEAVHIVDAESLSMFDIVCTAGTRCGTVCCTTFSCGESTLCSVSHTTKLCTKYLNPTLPLLQLSDVLGAVANVFFTLLGFFIASGLSLLSAIVVLHKSANIALLHDSNVTGIFAFLYSFPFLVNYTIPWAPPWAPICLWYCFLVQIFCTNGPPRMLSISRVVVPLLFLAEGVSYHSFLLDLTGKERTIEWIQVCVKSVGRGT